MNREITQKEFEKLCQIYGSSTDRWPTDTRNAAEDFQRQQPKITQRILGDERIVDKALSHIPQQTSNAALEARIVNSFSALQTKVTPRSDRFAPFAFLDVVGYQKSSIPAWSMALALLLVSGFVGGYTGYSYALDRTSSPDVIANAFGTEQTIIFEEDGAT